MPTEPNCYDLVYDRPPRVAPERWVHDWHIACSQRRLPDLWRFSISPDRCRLSIARRLGSRDFGRADNLGAVASVFAAFQAAPGPAPSPGPEPR